MTNPKLIERAEALRDIFKPWADAGVPNLKDAYEVITDLLFALRAPAQVTVTEEMVADAIRGHSSPGGLGKGDIHGGQVSYIVYEPYIRFIAASINAALAAEATHETSAPPMAPINDPIEQIVADGITSAGLSVARPVDPPFDFFLISDDVYVEVCQFYTPRKIKQLDKAENVILIQGRRAAEVFARLIQPERDVDHPGPSGPGEGVRTEPSASRSGTQPEPQLTEHEWEVLEMLVDQRKGTWGAWVSAGLEYLSEIGYATRGPHYKITEKGRERLDRRPADKTISTETPPQPLTPAGASSPDDMLAAAAALRAGAATTNNYGPVMRHLQDLCNLGGNALEAAAERENGLLHRIETLEAKKAELLTKLRIVSPMWEHAEAEVEALRAENSDLANRALPAGGEYRAMTKGAWDEANRRLEAAESTARDLRAKLEEARILLAQIDAAECKTDGNTWSILAVPDGTLHAINAFVEHTANDDAARVLTSKEG